MFPLPGALFSGSRMGGGLSLAIAGLRDGAEGATVTKLAHRNATRGSVCKDHRPERKQAEGRNETGHLETRE